MDFAKTEDQLSIETLAQQIFSDRVTAERLREIEAGAECFDRDLWAELATAGLLGVAIPTRFGGSGFGLTELILLLEQQAARTALVPLYASLVLGAAPLVAFGTDSQCQELLPAMARGELIMTGAFSESGGADGRLMATSARRVGENWSLSGTKVTVPAAHIADYVLVSAATDSGVGLFLVDLRSEGVEIAVQRTTTREFEGTITFTDVLLEGDAALPEQGQTILDWLQDARAVALAALQLGASREALAMTASYVSERQQFGRAIGSFQAIGQRAADCYIDLQAMESTLIEASWRLGSGLPVSQEAAIAKWWACQGGQRIAYACQHMHGGMGADIDYPIHRYFLWSKRLELEAGGSALQLARMGELLRA